MHLKYLDKTELAQLLAVPTTVDQALTILHRNESLKTMLEAGEYEGDSHHGCPHCKTTDKTCTFNYLCGSCAWYASTQKNMACCDQTFCGINAEHDDLLVAYASEFESISTPNWVENGGDCCDEEIVSLGFLGGHVEWAEVVIALGGTCEKDWREMTRQEQEAYDFPDVDDVIERLDITFLHEVGDWNQNWETKR